LAAAIQLGVALLSTEPSDLGDRHADHADSGERLLDVIQLERLDDRFDLLHAFPPGRSTKATPMPHPSQFAPTISITCARLSRGAPRRLPTKQAPRLRLLVFQAKAGAHRSKQRWRETSMTRPDRGGDRSVRLVREDRRRGRTKSGEVYRH